MEHQAEQLIMNFCSCICVFLCSVSMLNEEWCWADKSVDVEVIDEDLKGLEFVHNGYVLACSLSHSITLVRQSTKLGFYKLFSNSQGHITTGPQHCHL